MKNINLVPRLKMQHFQLQSPTIANSSKGHYIVFSEGGGEELDYNWI